ncbi:MAG TPA: erythromycin esterase family protein [Thermoanaerobaculia bacterium]|nr:erythromycin esterase family protein [Thermoanaerobaculia bacterium]
MTTWLWSIFFSNPLAFEAPASGLYIIELHVPEKAAAFLSTQTHTGVARFNVHIYEWLSASALSSRKKELRRDPRATWLRQHTVRLRSIEPDDHDFSDLNFLRRHLDNVSVVFLGEGDHGGGSDFKAKTRLIKFLHREMGFDVLAFESGLYAMSEAWRALQTDMDPREAFARGAAGVWARSEQVQPLIRYLAASARTTRPLELTGIGPDFTGTTSRQSLLPALHEVLIRSGIGGELTEEGSTQTRILAGILDGSFAQQGARLPTKDEQADLVAVLRNAAEQLDEADRDALFWSQTLRSTAAQVDLSLDRVRDPDGKTFFIGRERQMTENLLWFAEKYYAGRKIIVWVHTVHGMRGPQHTIAGREHGISVGQGVWDALGERSYVIGFTSYTGQTHWVTQPDDVQQDLVADADPAIEFEELMAATGHEFAFVDLRGARAAGTWLSGSFVARPMYFRPEQAPWSKILDAFLFIHTQEPSRKTSPPK